MRIQELIQHIDSNTLVEIIDKYARRLYYGRICELNIETWVLLQDVDFIALNCSIIKTGENTQEALLQIII